MTYEQRMRAAATVACFMMGFPIANEQRTQHDIVLICKPVKEMYNRIRGRLQSLTFEPLSYGITEHRRG